MGTVPRVSPIVRETLAAAGVSRFLRPPILRANEGPQNCCHSLPSASRVGNRARSRSQEAKTRCEGSPQGACQGWHATTWGNRPSAQWTKAWGTRPSAQWTRSPIDQNVGDQAKRPMDKSLGDQAKRPMDKSLGDQAKRPMDKKPNRQELGGTGQAPNRQEAYFHSVTPRHASASRIG
jgi:hypothetical protein